MFYYKPEKFGIIFEQQIFLGEVLALDGEVLAPDPDYEVLAKDGYIIW